jgi:hypothetical protein
MRKKPVKPEQPQFGPTNILIPNAAREKMEAIRDLCRAVNMLASVLGSSNVNVTMTGNITATGAGVSVSTAEA